MRLSLAPMVLGLVAGVAFCGVEESYVKKATWAETVIATRQNYQQSDEKAALTFGPWYVTAPLSGNFGDTHFAPEAIDLAAKDKNRSVWSQKPFADGVVHRLAGRDGASTYLYRMITAEQATTIQAGLGSDDGIEAWLNGKKVHSKDVPRGVGPDQDRLALELKAGENHLLMKIYNRTGDHGFYFAAGTNPLLPLWRLFERDFPAESSLLKQDLASSYLHFMVDKDALETERQLVQGVIGDIGTFGEKLAQRYANLEAGDEAAILDIYIEACRYRKGVQSLAAVNIVALRRAIEDLITTYGDEYAGGERFLSRLEKVERALGEGAAGDIAVVNEAVALQREALLANPAIDFEKLLVIRRKADRIGLPQNWQGNCSLAKTGYDNEIAYLDMQVDGRMETVYKPKGSEFVGDVDLHFDAGKMLFSMPGGKNNRWQIWEIGADGKGLRQVTVEDHPDVENYDACYLPDGRIVFASTRCFAGVPCVGGADLVANLCIMDADGRNARQLCFDQDHNWSPTMLNNGRVLYTRWEYSDTSHYFTRLLFSMNPDGTNQAEYYGSNSYWPNSMFYSRPIPNHATQVVTIVSGHHGVARMGELVILDPAKGRFEADGVVQRIPGYGKEVEAKIVDELVNDSWPKFLHPYPLSDKYFLVASQPRGGLWGIYLVDVFDNMLLLKEEPGYCMLEPLPFRKTQRPPVIPDRVDLKAKDALVYLFDVYMGQGMEGVPRGTVQSLRLFELHYGYPNMGGHRHIAVQGAWDVHRILGTVPVYEDGSAFFRVPANTPLVVQPLDSQGRAVQLMRSWFTAMPGETVSCVGCHEKQNTTAPSRPIIAAMQAPTPIKPWYGPGRGFSFKREIQPVLDKHCVGCHDGSPAPGGIARPDLRAKDKNGWSNFTPSYLELHPYVRRPGPESDYHVLKPYAYHADTSELVQMLRKGHYNVSLDQEAWERLYTWIDLNVPDHGTWGEHQNIPRQFDARRMDMRTLYANRSENPEEIVTAHTRPVKFVQPKPMPSLATSEITVPDWPFDAAAARQRQAAAGETRKTLDLGGGATMEFVRIPAGEFVMGSLEGGVDEMPLSRVQIDQPFWMGVIEVTNAQFKQFNPAHFNGFIDQQHKDHTTPGYPMNDPEHPAVRVSWDEAMAFCQWLSATTGLKATLPTEAQWEWACRAGARSAMHFGDVDADFSGHANLADVSIKLLAVSGVNPQPIANPSRYDAFIPKIDSVNDGAKIVAHAGQYAPNAWGLKDMHGNVSEWTRSMYAAYPYSESDGRNDLAAQGQRVARGGSWYERPKRATSSYRFMYERYQKVYNVGFRVICE
ncbi:MAG: SUMF1/EgtB/PvdO family nonheme iron enzyme [Phycisphaerae bacterium]|nr:SUMF1/EgtB/PvdO family nonheme iron enzyme [Phycisphaerae bacterium]